MTSLVRSLCSVVLAIAVTIVAGPAVAQDTIKIHYVAPFSGPFSSGGDEFLKVFAYILAKANADGGALGKKFEIVSFDDKLQPAEALIALKNITDQNNDTDFSEVPFPAMFQMLAKAIDQAGSTDALSVANALEDMKTTDLVGTPAEMRGEDHLLLMPCYAATFSWDVKYDLEKTRFGWKTDFIATAEDPTLSTTCKMKRQTS
jgi:ABC-type branched-subunit amino acid transport system substrate-binding protein